MNEVKQYDQLSGNAALSAALIALLTITAVMLAALLTETEPHPPNRIPLFALAPFLGMSLAAGLSALFLANRGERLTWVPAGLFAGTGLLSFGPQKLIDPAFPLIWPSVLAAQVCIAIILVQCVKQVRRHRTG